MRAFAALLDALIYTRSRHAKLALLGAFLREQPDPDRGWALAALTGTLDLPAVKPATVRRAVEARVDPVLFRLSRDYVGDTAETVALIWPDPPVPPAGPPGLAECVGMLAAAPRADAADLLAALLDRMSAEERFALLKLATGALRVGVSARLAKAGFAEAFGVDLAEVEELWHGLAPPYAALFAWGEGGAKPALDEQPLFRAFMLAQPFDGAAVDLADYAAEWKWDGIRIQLVRSGGATRLYSRGGDDITASFPEIAAAFTLAGVADGELMVRGAAQGVGLDGADQAAASFNALQQRLGRKAADARLQARYPAFVRLYDLLFEGGVDLRDEPWSARRAALERVMPQLPADRFDLSALIAAEDFAALERLRDGARDAAIEGVMLKRRDAPYVAGRRAGLWYKWKRAPLTADCVVMYAQRGAGRRSSYYSDFTFGCWAADGALLPVGKAYSGISDAELKQLDAFVRANSIARFGPVREVAKTLVLEIAFDSIHASTRHKSGVAMRFPRIARIRTDKPAAEADTLETLKQLVT
ncbi:cisplatin damage response ATP-dependent DNA ligase [Sphingomonas sp.]|uniref:cisplatin damage response ATP-dependent DNA ligase n=1 Tax=Sphingomonas sp. TaxID=28214 RepID=UPI001D6C0E56|nr:cisplatin damage response ATP-dependent DNA ligase [Sphingomonas sp.]MBX9795760.1 cisplatin damage response ATP-dependent DNA ligase [Sphingomonas sp.]